MKKPGFTLIELLVVIAIIALLLSIILPSLGRAKDLAKRVVCATHLKQVGTAMVTYSDASGGWLPPSHGLAHTYVVYRMDTQVNGKLKPHRWAYLYESDYIETPEIFYCPANRAEWAKYESYTSPGPWGTLPQNFNSAGNGNQMVRIGYTYFPLKRNARDGSDEAAKYGELNPHLPYATDILLGRPAIPHQRSSGYDDPTYRESNRYLINTLYPDGHVSSCKDRDVFRHSVWDNFTHPYRDQTYTVYRLIGSQ